ncbi:hypothetical protein RhiirA5_410767 [Rhizophagus irregularis]|uniref:Uncharacterized protein n=1 Tax=Rhizophagus irregularis TaxID=588596 RepID=A0A2N0Q2N7_9GLOM|nr:hypothetical protein RhiirA5_410767 [Rhizophagus irregularis]
MATMMSSELEILRQRTTELEAENAKLKQIIDENSRLDARVEELEQKNTELEARLAIVEQSSLGVVGQLQNDKEAILEVLPEAVEAIGEASTRNSEFVPRGRKKRFAILSPKNNVDCQSVSETMTNLSRSDYVNTLDKVELEQDDEIDLVDMSNYRTRSNSRIECKVSCQSSGDGCN